MAIVVYRGAGTISAVGNALYIGLYCYFEGVQAREIFGRYIISLFKVLTVHEKVL